MTDISDTLPWPAWAAMLAGRALLSDAAEAHVLRGLAGWEPQPDQVHALEQAVPSLDARHTRAGLAVALGMAADAGGTFRANAAALGLVALVTSAASDLDDPRVFSDDDDDLIFDDGPELVLDHSPAMTEPLAWIAGVAVPLAEADPDLADPREMLRRVADHPRLLPRIARLARDVLAGSASDRQDARRLTRLGERVAGLAPGVVDVDAAGRLYLGGRPLYWIRRREGGRSDRCYASLSTRAGRLVLAVAIGDAPTAVPSEVCSQARVGLARLGVRLTRSLTLEPGLRLAARAARAWRLLGSDLPAERPRPRRRTPAKS